MRIEKALNLPEPAVLAVVGCGGKSSLIKLLAMSFPGKKVLISPTTKMFPININNADCVGQLNSKTGKLEALPPEKLTELIQGYDISLLEADGSRGLPLKGWLHNEPVVPGYCTHTIGVATINPLGKKLAAEIVFNLPQFLKLTGLCEGEKITCDALHKMICAPGGMFKNSAGSRVLLINQVESGIVANRAESFLQKIKQNYPGFFEKILYGSVFYNAWTEI